MHVQLKMALLAGVVTAWTALPAVADQVDVIATRDNTLIADSSGLLSGGLSPYFFAGRTSQSPDVNIRRGLMRFDLTGVIPPGSVINSVTLRLRMSKSTQAGTNPFTIHRMLADWGEGTSTAGGGGGGGGALSTVNDATWIHRFYDTVFWATPGGDFNPTASATTSVAATIGFYTWSSAAMAADVQGWVNNPATNFGWMLRGNEIPSSTTAKRFDSKDNTTAGNRPRLTINFTPGANVGACCLPGNVCIFTSPAGCTSQSGVYQGNGTNCNTSPCGPPPSGACCFNNTTCQTLTAANCAAQGGTYQGDGIPCTAGLCPLVLTPFLDPLPILPVMQPIIGVPGGAATYEITVREFTHQLHQNLPPTRLWGYNGAYPGATIEARTGQPVTVHWISDIRDENGNLRTEHLLPVDLCLHGPDMLGPTPRTTVHLHGAKVPPGSDGYPETTILPGESQTFTYPNNQLPATLWYHDHALGITRLNVYLGLAGLYLIRDQFEQTLGLPFGENEIALIIQDRSFNLDGSMQYPEMWMEDFFGNTMLVNGKVWPYLNVKRGQYRFRILNACNSRTLTLALSNNQFFQQIGTDGGLKPSPVGINQITLLPAERADVVIDFAALDPGTNVALVNSAPAPFPGKPGVGVVPNVMQFRVQSQVGFGNPVPSNLRPLDVIPTSQARRQRDFVLRMMDMGDAECPMMMWAINDLMWDDIVEFPQLGQVEIWRFINQSGMSHAMHLHLVQFQVLDRQAFVLQNNQVVPIGSPAPPAPTEVGWKDTVRVDPSTLVRVIARFDGYTGLYPYHCHMLEHEDNEMMRQFEVRLPCPGDVAPAPDGDREVDVDDLLAVITGWGPCPAPCPIDTVLNGQIDVNDLLAVITNWGSCP